MHMFTVVYCPVLVQNLLTVGISSSEGYELQSFMTSWYFPLQLKVGFTDLPCLHLKMPFVISCSRIVDCKMFFIPMVVMLDFSVLGFTARCKY